MIWSEVDPLDDGLVAVVSWWHSEHRTRYRLEGTIEVGNPIVLHPYPHLHSLDPSPLPPTVPPWDARVHIIAGHEPLGARYPHPGGPVR